MSIDHSVVPWLAHKLVILSLMFHDGLDANTSARVEDIEFEELHHVMDM